MKETKKMTGNKPKQTIRAGAVKATIWENDLQTKNGVVKTNSVVLTRSYKDKEGNWQENNKFNKNELPKAILVMQKAYEYLATNTSNDEEE